MNELISYQLSKNDLDIIKYYTKGKEISSLARKSMTILSNVFGGLHHLEPSQLEKFLWFENLYNEYSLARSLSTFDPQELTLLVIMAHDMAVRVTIRPCNFQYLKLQFHERQREGNFCTRHPSLESVTSGFRKGEKRIA